MKPAEELEEEGGAAEEAGGAGGVVAAVVQGVVRGGQAQTQGAIQSKIGAAVEGQTAIQNRIGEATPEEPEQEEDLGRTQGLGATRAPLSVVEALSIPRPTLEGVGTLLGLVHMAVGPTADMVERAVMVELDTTTDLPAMAPTLGPTSAVAWAGIRGRGVGSARRRLDSVLALASLVALPLELLAVLLCMESTTGKPPNSS